MSSSKIQEYNLDPNMGLAKEETSQEILSAVTAVSLGTSVVKSIQKVSLSFKLSDKGGSTTINPVDASRCVVIMEYLTNATVEYTISYTLTNDSLSVTTTSGYSTTVKFGFWIIEFY